MSTQVLPELSRLVSRGDGTHRVVLHLQPAALGDVRVVLTVRGGEVRVSLAAGTEARAALLTDAPALHRMLASSGAESTRVVVRDLTGARPGTLAPAVTSPAPGSSAGALTGTSTGTSAGTSTGSPTSTSTSSPTSNGIATGAPTGTPAGAPTTPPAAPTTAPAAATATADGTGSLGPGAFGAGHHSSPGHGSPGGGQAWTPGHTPAMDGRSSDGAQPGSRQPIDHATAPVTGVDVTM